MATKRTEEEYIDPEEFEASKVTADAPRGNDAGDGAEAGDPGDDTGKTRKEERQQRREERKEERQQRREQRRENGTGLGAEARALVNGTRERLKDEVNALRGRSTEEPEPVSPDDVAVAQGGGTAQGVTNVTGQADNANNGRYNADTARPDETTPEAFNSTLEKRQQDFAKTTQDIADNPTITPPPARTQETTVEETPKQEVTESPTEDVTENPSGGGGLSPSVRNFAEGLDKRQKDFTKSIQDTAGSFTSPTGAAAKGATETAPAQTAQAAEAGNAGSAYTAAGNTGNPPAGGGRTASGSETSVTKKWQEPYQYTPEQYDPNEDIYVQKTREANNALNEEFTRPANPDDPNDRGGVFPTFEAMIDEFRKYDEERTRRDSEDAFWRGIGEVGASLANFLGVSGAFGGRNAYGRGAYSAMQNFDLTTSKLTDKMKADRDKRRERMDALNDKMRDLQLQWAQLRSKGIENEGKAAAEGQRAVDNRNFQREGWRYQSEETRKQREWQAEQNDLNRKSDERKASIRANGSGTEQKPDTFVTFAIGKSKDGKTRQADFTVRKSVLEDTLAKTSGELANYIARELGYDDYNDFLRDTDKLQKDDIYTRAQEKADAGTMRGQTDNEVKGSVDRLLKYGTLPELGSIIGEDKDALSYLAQWARDNGEYYKEYGEYLHRYLQTNGFISSDASKNEKQNLPPGVTENQGQ